MALWDPTHHDTRVAKYEKKERQHNPHLVPIADVVWPKIREGQVGKDRTQEQIRRDPEESSKSATFPAEALAKDVEEAKRVDPPVHKALHHPTKLPNPNFVNHWLGLRS